MSLRNTETDRLVVIHCVPEINPWYLNQGFITPRDMFYIIWVSCQANILQLQHLWIKLWRPLSVLQLSCLKGRILLIHYNSSFFCTLSKANAIISFVCKQQTAKGHSLPFCLTFTWISSCLNIQLDYSTAPLLSALIQHFFPLLSIPFFCRL